MRNIWAIILFMPFLSKSQDIVSEGIQFIKSSSWEQVLQKAKAENKIIFIDCYTTWCAPCKAMEKIFIH